MSELFPIVAGLLCGLLLGSLTARRRMIVGLAFLEQLGVAPALRHRDRFRDGRLHHRCQVDRDHEHRAPHAEHPQQ